MEDALHNDHGKEQTSSARIKFSDDIEPSLKQRVWTFRSCLVPSSSQISKMIDEQFFGLLSVLRIWRLESLACLISVMMLLSIIALLYPYRNADLPIPNLPYHITTNALLSIFVTVMRACIILILAEGLGQLKWTYFLKRRTLNYLVAYDSATRGLWGCVEFILMSNYHNVVPAVGALVMVLTIAIEPFTQQLVHYYPCQVQVGNGSIASIPRSSLYNEYGPPVGADLLTPSLAQVSSIIGTVFNSDALNLPVLCPTGDCSFQPYTTLEFCASCQDVTDELNISVYNETVKITEDGINTIRRNIKPMRSLAKSASSNMRNLPYNITSVNMSLPQTYIVIIVNTSLPSGLWASSSLDQVFSMRGYQDDMDQLSLVVEMLLASHSQTSGDPTTNSPTQQTSLSTSDCGNAWENQTWGCIDKGAARCSIRPCVRSYTATVEGGIVKEVLLESFSDWSTGTASYGVLGTFSMTDMDCLNASTKELLQKKVFNISGSRFLPLNITVDPSNGNVIQSSSGSSEATTPTSSNDISLSVPENCVYTISAPTISALGRFFQSYFTSYVNLSSNLVGLTGNEQSLKILNNTYIQFEDVNHIFHAIAKAMTYRLRQWNWNNTQVFSQPAVGTVNALDTCIQVRWAWIAYPVAITLTTIFFFVAMVCITTKEDSGGLVRGWKNSPLPLIFHGIDGIEGGLEGGGPEPVSDIRYMERAAQDTTGLITLRGH